MGASKFLVLVGGVVGIVSFFLPLIEIKDQGAISAFQVVKGIDTVKDMGRDLSERRFGKMATTFPAV